MNPRAQDVELVVVDFKTVFVKCPIGGKILEQGVPLGDYFMIVQHILQILLIGLGNNAIHEFTPDFTTLQDQVSV